MSILGRLVGSVRIRGIRFAYYRDSKRRLSAEHGDSRFDHIVTGDCEDIIQMRASVEPEPPIIQAQKVLNGKTHHRSARSK